MSTKVTMQQIADHVGVSKFAVSKALSGKSGVSAATREKIVEAATQLGYFTQKRRKPPDVRSAATARPGARHTIIVLIPNVRDQNRQSAYWGRIIDGISEALEWHQLGMMIVTDQSGDHFSQLINPSAVLGLIGVGHIANQLLLEVRNLGLPFVLVDHEDPLIPADTLFMNNDECMRRIVHYLLGIGHRSFQFVGHIGFSRSFRDRWRGFQSMLEEQGIPLAQEERLLALEVVDEVKMTEALEQIVQDLVSRRALPNAFVCANDAIALRVLAVLAKLQIRVPEQLSVTGFDNIADAAVSQPALSTVHVNKEALGRRAVAALLRRIDHPDEPQEQILLAGDLVLRDSIAGVHGQDQESKLQPNKSHLLS